MLRAGKGYDSARNAERLLSPFGDSLQIMQQLAV